MLACASRRSPPQHLSHPLFPTITAIVLNFSLTKKNLSGLLTLAESFAMPNL
ncbi:MAG: hypothetical protein SFY66_21130 [Oculatellaceae cyanobacterium bins.114]|nr:hypothetical protein [Oculatellaceae cyanobacterium bins.114]